MALNIQVDLTELSFLINIVKCGILTTSIQINLHKYIIIRGMHMALYIAYILRTVRLFYLQLLTAPQTSTRTQIEQ